MGSTWLIALQDQDLYGLPKAFFPDGSTCHEILAAQGIKVQIIIAIRRKKCI